MYIGHKESKSKKRYEIYLRHSKRVNGESGKSFDKFLFSVKKEDLKHRENDRQFEVEGYIIEEFRGVIQKKIKEIPQKISEELKDEFSDGKLLNLLMDKIAELKRKENE